MNEPPLVRVAANCIRRMIYQYRDDFQAGMIVAGWDKKLGGQVSLSHTNYFFLNYLFRSIHVHSVV
jgi:20S proteasome alpha/beta subunit